MTFGAASLTLLGYGRKVPVDPDDSYSAPLIRAVREGRLPLERLRASVTVLLRTAAILTTEVNPR